jgi:hypothetical protein
MIRESTGAAGHAPTDLTAVTTLAHTGSRICNWAAGQDPVIERIMLLARVLFCWPEAVVTGDSKEGK